MKDYAWTTETTEMLVFLILSDCAVRLDRLESIWVDDDDAERTVLEMCSGECVVSDEPVEDVLKELKRMMGKGL